MDARTTEHTSNALMGRNGLLRKNNVTVVLVTHNRKLCYLFTKHSNLDANSDLDKMMALADTIIAVEGGAVVGTGSPADLLGIDGHVGNVGLDLRDEVPEGMNWDVISTGSTGQEPRMPEESIEETLTSPDDARRKSGDPAVYKYYFASSGWMIVFLFVTCLVLWIFCTEFPSKLDRAILPWMFSHSTNQLSSNLAEMVVRG